MILNQFTHYQEVILQQKIDFGEVFNQSFETAVLADTERFYALFYEHFFSVSEDISKAFANTDMPRQHEMLHDSLINMISFSENKKASRYFQKMAITHGKMGVGVRIALFDVWLDCLLMTVKDLDQQYDDQVDLAWRIVLAPGMVFMKSFGVDDSNNSAGKAPDEEDSKTT